MLSVARMFQRLFRAAKYAAKEESFAAVFGAAIVLVIVGTITYSLGEGWSVGDGFYFAVCTLTTSSIADPNLTLTHEAMKIFTALYVLTGIGILVELARQLGVGFVKMREEPQRHQTCPARRETRPAPQGRSARDAGWVTRRTPGGRCGRALHEREHLASSCAREQRQSQTPGPAAAQRYALAMRAAVMLIVSVALAAVALVAAGCGSSGKPAYCSNVSDLQQSVTDLKSVQLQSGALSTLQTDLQTVQTNADAVVSSAKADFPSQTSALQSSVSSLSTAIQKLPRPRRPSSWPRSCRRSTAP